MYKDTIYSQYTQDPSYIYNPDLTCENISDNIGGNDIYFDTNEHEMIEITNHSPKNDVINTQDDIFRGKTVVLVDSSNPWYLNIDETDAIPWVQPEQHQSNKMYTSNKQKNVSNKKKININDNKDTEEKEDTNGKTQIHIIIILLVIVLLLVFYKSFYKR
jgi:hypothetical protein